MMKMMLTMMVVVVTMMVMMVTMMVMMVVARRLIPAAITPRAAPGKM